MSDFFAEILAGIIEAMLPERVLVALGLAVLVIGFIIWIWAPEAAP